MKSTRVIETSHTNVRIAIRTVLTNVDAYRTYYSRTKYTWSTYISSIPPPGVSGTAIREVFVGATQIVL